jgi:CheY-like chemotaxis protein
MERDVNPAKLEPRLILASELADALSSPLGGLLGLGELLQRQALSSAARSQLDGLIEAAKSMARLLEDVGDAERLRQPPSPQSVRLRDLLDEVEGFWRDRSAGAGPALLVSCAAPADLRVSVDPARLRHFLNLLIEDALETAARGVVDVQISASETGGEIRLTGRLDCMRGAQRVNPLRLEFCRSAAEEMHGAFVQSVQPGGAESLSFHLVLPPGARDGASQSDEAEPLPPRTHLLIVDDNATNRMVAAALCDMFGATSETAEDGFEALQAVKARPFDLILMDIKMPRMDGLEATRAIRALGGAAANIPIVALTANADAQAVASYLAGGMVAVVDKPIKPAQLLLALQHALDVAPRPAATMVDAA